MRHALLLLSLLACGAAAQTAAPQPAPPEPAIRVEVYCVDGKPVELLIATNGAGVWSARFEAMPVCPPAPPPQQQPRDQRQPRRSGVA